MGQNLLDITRNKMIKAFLITEQATVKEAMRQIAKNGEKILFVVDDDNRLLGSLTDGDIRRWVLAEGELTASLANVYYKTPVFVEENYDIEKVKELLVGHKIEVIPVINDQRVVIDFLSWNKVLGAGITIPKEKINVPVVIMAGGKGTRLDPFTRILPKPLIPIGEKAILEIIMDKFHVYGVKDFFISVNHKSSMIKAYFEELGTPYSISYIEEEKPLGTAGGLKFLENKINKDVLVSNCDIIIETDYTEIIKFHQNGGYQMTIVGSFRHFTIPYGICTIKDGGSLISIDEKPEYDYLVNTGMYLISKDVLKLIPSNKVFNMTDLVKKIKDNQGKVGVFPIDEKSWIDIGQWEEYQKTMRELKIKL